MDLEPVSGEDSAATSEWGGLADFAVDDEDEDDTLFPAWALSASDLLTPLPPPVTAPTPLLLAPPPGEDSDLALQRDPRLFCSNFLAGRTPCSCPGKDGMVTDAGASAGAVGGGRKPRAAPVVALLCQVPGCQADIRELKGYHRRHRVCLRCASASAVVLDGGSKRYCQQCGKFHMLSDFDEGKRSCRRKLERHNKRRLRRHTDTIIMAQKDKDPQRGPQIEVSCIGECKTEVNDLSCQTDEKVVGNKLIERKVPLELDDGYDSSFSLLSCFTTTPVDHDIFSFTASNKPHNEEKVDNSKFSISSTLCNSKSGYSSACPTGRISFKLYDWNPAEFPRQLRHQILHWLASMPVELEGYIRPGCTFLTAFISMPDFMWEKLSLDVSGCIQDLIYAPESLLVGRGNIHINLFNTIVQIIKGEIPLVSTRMEVQVPMLHYIYPTVFEAGQPVEFIACGSNLNQPKFRFLVSFSEKYLELSSSVVISNDKDTTCNIKDVHNGEHETFRINIPQTDSNIFGPAFVEVENELGVSNFVPILFANKLVCSELQRIYRILCDSCCIVDTSYIFSTYTFVSKQVGIPTLLLDIGWVLREPRLEKTKEIVSSTNIQRLVNLLKFLLQMESFILLQAVLRYIDEINWPSHHEAIDISDGDWCLFLNYVNQAREMLSQITPHHMIRKSDSRSMTPPDCHFSQSCGKNDTQHNLISANQDSEGRNNDGFDLIALEPENCEATPLIALERSRTLICQPQVDVRWKTLPCFSKHSSMHVALILAVSALVCFAACVTLFHPHNAADIVTFIRRRLFHNQKT
ncbi:hypothetical protein Cni_G12061 [Canna indica]|uniref:SBP-type domain-containing protein n=1 Tax=Canna indica TaxID=4628 RepID=A0AAQ3KCU5_9LILI|nr:hypothetical protein Cni_G12061 [Canna indica]